MNRILQYFTALVATALIGVLFSNLVKDQKINSILQLTIGLLLLLVLLKPIATAKIDQLGEEVGRIFREEFQMQNYESLYKDKLRAQVKTLTEEYVIKKAHSLNATVSVEVELSTSDGYPTPQWIRIVGILTGEQKEILQEYVTVELGIAPENQRWDLYE